MVKEDTFNQIRDVGIIPAVRTSIPEEAVQAAEAIWLGGIAVVEISFAPSNYLEVLNAVVAAHSHKILIGAGSIVDGEGVRQASRAGARFIVTPGFSREAVDTAKELGLSIFAGALTPTEVQEAAACGVDAVKLFPCFAAGGTRYLKSLRAQYPTVKFIASGGVGLDNCADYIRAGACAIGVGGEIADFESMSGENFRVFTVRAKRLCEAVRNAKVLMEASDAFNVGEGR
jgi:2-dehydro-3-deoxyphosphogluconate aldolase / (4S)-4-hydroxy-2-oxoglutarate aldolase